MAPPFTVSISNKSGVQQSYAIYADPPHITCSGTPPLVTTSIISAVRGVADKTGEASFILAKSLYATCGTYNVEFDDEFDGNKSPIGTGTEVVDQRPVTLGKNDNQGKLVGGTVLEIDTSGGCPTFANKDLEATAEVDSFVLRTVGDFTAYEAKMNKFVLGFSSSLKHAVGPYATFVPAPGKIYTIKPAKIFHIIVGSFNSRDLVRAEVLKDNESVKAIDFGILGTDSVQLIHDEHNTIQIANLPRN